MLRDEKQAGSPGNDEYQPQKQATSEAVWQIPGVGGGRTITPRDRCSKHLFLTCPCAILNIWFSGGARAMSTLVIRGKLSVVYEQQVSQGGISGVSNYLPRSEPHVCISPVSLSTSSPLNQMKRQCEPDALPRRLSFHRTAASRLRDDHVG
ncbi:hypothetical protein BaRGS_00023811 [Batillaria attramentaria]|uniref:Uncharacterized protein n=1 Tax=Batillaria attramentaria TaxID=370345 RepID=A0ABD0KD00_9CAEN